MRPVALTEALKRAGVALGLGRKVSPHWFRHTFNDLLRRAASGEVQRAIVGHSSPAMSEHYSHVGIEERRAAVGAALALVRPGDPSGDVGNGGPGR